MSALLCPKGGLFDAHRYYNTAPLLMQQLNISYSLPKLVQPLSFGKAAFLLPFQHRKKVKRMESNDVFDLLLMLLDDDLFWISEKDDE